MDCEDCNKRDSVTHLVYDNNKKCFFFLCRECINPKTDKAISIEEIQKKIGN